MKALRVTPEVFAESLTLADGLVLGPKEVLLQVTLPAPFDPAERFDVWYGQVRNFLGAGGSYIRDHRQPPTGPGLTLLLLRRVPGARSRLRWQRPDEAELALMVVGLELKRQRELPGEWSEEAGQRYVWVIRGQVRYVTAPAAVLRRLASLKRQRAVLKARHRRVDERQRVLEQSIKALDRPLRLYGQEGTQ
jgi:hypothetical protein